MATSATRKGLRNLRNSRVQLEEKITGKVKYGRAIWKTSCRNVLLDSITLVSN